MRKKLSLLLTASFLFISQGAMASSSGNAIGIDDDNDVVQNAVSTSVPAASQAGESQSKRRRGNEGTQIAEPAPLNMRCEIVTLPDGTTTQKWSNIFSYLPHLVRVEIMEFLQKYPQAQLNLMNISHGMRRLALQMPGRYDNTVSTGNDLKKHLRMVLIGGQTGDPSLFMQHQSKNFSQQTLAELQQDYESFYYKDNLKPTTPRGHLYQTIDKFVETYDTGEENQLYTPGHLLIQPYMTQNTKLRLFPTNFSCVQRFSKLVLQAHELRIFPDLSNCNLSEIDIAENQIRRLPDLSHQPHLRMVNLSKNRFTDVSEITKCTGLVSLNISNNPLSTFPDFSNFRALEYLGLAGLGLRSVPSSVPLGNLKELDLSNNNLTDSSFLNALVAVEELNLKGNQLTSLQALPPQSPLRLLNVSNNLLTDVAGLENRQSLGFVYLSHNQITNVGDLSRWPSLIEMNLSHNPLTSIPDVSKKPGLTLHLN